ncbi:helix-turn-helix domain-containing protein [Paludibacterium purpuratum]|uniref:Uncharacterized protein n=1 Tax=Paludibacterium purpuratum TaxID=1144873 RepID=A0A4R7BDW8_9NEIS|nr:helix-turn-helix transcriptional regulator [Paludibacterium purpuratum]TDR82185.1 hypothetical protein DFP86_102299 [Paludibacterium purpuratum]
MDEIIIPSLAHRIRQILMDPKLKQELMTVLGWDNSNVSRYLAGNLGITEDKIDKVVEFLGILNVENRRLAPIIDMADVGFKAIKLDFERRFATRETLMKKAG